ncbi:TRAP transporter small permease [Devosia sp. A449]
MRRLENFLGHLTGLLFMLMIVLVTIQVGNRFVIRLPMPWTEELTRIAYVALIFVGSVAAAMRSEHIRVGVLYEIFPARVRQVLHILFGLVAAAFMILVAYGAYLYARIGWTAPLPTMAWLKMGYVQALIGVCAVAMAVAFLAWIFKAKEPPRHTIVELEQN